MILPLQKNSNNSAKCLILLGARGQKLEKTGFGVELGGVRLDEFFLIQDVFRQFDNIDIFHAIPKKANVQSQRSRLIRLPWSFLKKIKHPQTIDLWVEIIIVACHLQWTA
jgi:hypothetical protein